MTNIGLAALTRNYQSGMTFAELVDRHTPVNALSPDQLMDRIRQWVVRELEPASPGVYHVPADFDEGDADPDEPGSDTLYSLFDGVEGYIDTLLPTESIREALAQMTTCKYQTISWNIAPVWLDAAEYNPDTQHWTFKPAEHMRRNMIKLQALPRGNMTRHSCYWGYMQAVYEKLHAAHQAPTLAQVAACAFVLHNKRATLSPLFHAWAAIASTT